MGQCKGTDQARPAGIAPACVISAITTDRAPLSVDGASRTAHQGSLQGQKGGRVGARERATEEEIKKLSTNTGASCDALGGGLFLPTDEPSFDSPEVTRTLSEGPRSGKAIVTPQQSIWFETFWTEYWIKRGKMPAERAFAKHVTTEARFEQVMTAVRAQKPQMLQRVSEGSTPKYAEGWLNDNRWEDEAELPAAKPAQSANSSRQVGTAQSELSRYIAR